MARVVLSSLPEGTILQGGSYLPAAGATVNVYQHGTTTQVTVYQAETGAATYAQPLTTDTNGQVPGWVDAYQDLDVVATYQGVQAGPVQAEPVIASGVLPLVFNVKNPMYGGGAKGDGVTVDTTAVQNCVNDCLAAGGGIVYFPPGTYIMAMVTFGSNVVARGAGVGVTVLKMDPAVYTNTALYGTPSTALVARVAPASTTVSSSNFKMEDLTIDGNMSTWGNSTTNRMMGFYLGQGTAGLISHCKMRNVEIRACMSYAFDIENATDIDLESCWAHDNGYTTGTGTHIACDGFTLIGSDITAVNCRSYNNSSNGYLCGQNAFTWYRIKLLGCTANGNNNHGATLGSDATGALRDSQVVGGSYVNNTTGSGVQLTTNAIGCTVTGINATGNGQDGIRVSAASYCSITGNSLQNNAVASSANPEIYLLTSAVRNSVVGNVINSTTATHAIQEQNSTTDYNIIANNEVTATTGTILAAGLHTQVRGNVGYNPVGAVTVTVPASGTAVAAVQYDRTFYVTAGTSTVTMAISPGPSPVVPASGFAAIRVPATATVTPTYTVSPTWVVEGE